MYHTSVHVCQWDLCKKYVQKSYFSHLWCFGTKSYNNSQTNDIYDFPSKYMAASFNAKKTNFKNLTYEIKDVKKCPVRNVTDSHFVTDGTVNAVKRIVCTDQWRKMYMIPAHVTGWGFHSCTWQDSLKKKHLVLQFLFVQIFKKNFLKMDILYRTYYTSIGLKM